MNKRLQALDEMEQNDQVNGLYLDKGQSVNHKPVTKVSLKLFTPIYENNYEDVPLDTTLLVWDGCEYDVNFVKVCGDTCRKYPAGG